MTTTKAETQRHDLLRGTTPARWVETRTETKGQKVKTQVLETLSLEGRYEPFVESEQETIQVDSQTIRTLHRLFARDPDGRRIVIEVTEQERRNLPGGRVRIVRTTSKPDFNGNFQFTRREIQETTPLSSTVRESRTTVLLPDINEILAPAEEIHQTEQRKQSGVVEVKRRHLLRDGNDRWELYEIQERVVQSEDNDARTEEVIYRRDANRKLSLAERSVAKQWNDAKGHEHETVETYSRNIAGTTRYGDGRLRLDRRLRIVRSTGPNSSVRTVQELEQRSIVAPADGLRLTERVVELSGPGDRGGIEKQRTVQQLDPNQRIKTILIFKTREPKT